jgi:hypothetical protein
MTVPQPLVVRHDGGQGEPPEKPPCQQGEASEDHNAHEGDPQGRAETALHFTWQEGQGGTEGHKRQENNQAPAQQNAKRFIDWEFLHRFTGSERLWESSDGTRTASIP